MSIISREVQLASHPSGMPQISDFKLAERPLDAPRTGEVIVKNHYFSVDPSLRRPLSDGSIQTGHRIVNQTNRGFAIGEVVETRHPDFSEGDIVEHHMSLCEYARVKGEELTGLEIGDEPITTHLGVLGITGLTAYVGMLRVAELRRKENVFVSAAAGAVGSVAAQIAKNMECQVIGSAGTDEKCSWLKDKVGLDEVFNYNNGVVRKSLKAAAPNGLDVYFDNVGGEHLNAALPRMNKFGRIAACGMISSYNDPLGLSSGITTLSTIMYNRVTIKGYTVTDHYDMRPQFLKDMKAWIADGHMVWEETIYEGIDKTPDAIIGLLKGDNTGKALVKVSA